MRLKTHRSDALLLLAAGATDYCLVVLEGGALRVRINLGAGESELSSPPRLRLDDLLWHDVRISRNTADMILTIDGIHTTRLTLPGRFHELNVHYGVFLGGMGDFTEVFLGLLDNFRGCLDQVVYNGLDVFREVQEDPKSADVYGVEWECSDEFDSPPDAAISFVKPGAYVAFQDSYPRTGGSIKMEVKTMKENALLVYNTGPPSRSDFIALEIHEGRPRLVLDKGNGAVGLNSTIYISDGVWHHLEAHFKPTYMELNVDDHIEDQPTHVGENKYFDLSGYLFVGGVEVNKQARAVKQGSRNGDKSLEGCIQNLFIGDRRLSIRDARVTLGIKADCNWAYPCLKNPCVDGARCVQEGTDGFKCECDLALCVRQNFTTAYKVFTKTTLPFNLEILSLTPMEVHEGGQALITANHLNLVLDYEKYGVRESGVHFHVITPPSRGRLDIHLPRRPENTVFTLLDLNDDRVTYIHDGSETTEDSIVLELELVTRSGYILPSYLQSRHRFVLPIRIITKNDAPTIQLPPGKVLRLASGTAKTLTPDILTVEDNDSTPDKLRISVLNLNDPEGGYIQHSQAPGEPIHSFTLEALNEGLISYVHPGETSSNSKIVFKVSDGTATSESAVLRVAAFELQVYLINNTGLSITHDSWALLTPFNLSYTTNAPEQDLEIRFDITEPPRFGAVQRVRGNDRWQNVNQFSSRQLEKEKIRYIHTDKEPSVDEFRFKISAGQRKFPTEYTFRISFVAVTVDVVRNAELLIDRIQESFISEGFLQSVTKPESTPSSDIIYTVITSPMYGSLYQSSGDLTRHQELEKDSTFTQEDIAKGRIKYKLHRKSYSSLRDSFQFQVSSHGRTSGVHTFNIRHTPPSVDARIVVERLDVDEGATTKITQKYLHIEVEDIDNLIYNITSPPKHGSINIVDESMILPERRNATYFTSKEILAGSVFYQHDDSESPKDRFHFVALAEDPEVDFQYVGVMHFKIIMINDNHPERVLEKVLNVVTQSERVVTSSDLLYIDPDLDTPATQIQYTRRKIPNGDFFHIQDRSKPVYVFTQEDINQRRIVFRHEGPSYGKAVISVTDGQLSSTGILEIVASEPFIEIVNNSGIIVPRKQQAIISNYNLSVETNMNAWGDAIVFHVTSPPRYGTLVTQGKAGAKVFTEADLQSKTLKYVNKGETSFRDEFRFRARIGDTTSEGIFEIKVYPESYWEPLVVRNNVTVKVEEGSRVTIDQAALKIMHPNIAPSDITYVIVQRPQNGYLEVDLGQITTSEYEDEASLLKPEVSVFDQALINEGKVQYVETGTNVTADHFVFDVTNGISSLSRLVYNIEVIPKTIYLSTGSLHVDEGSQTIVTTEVVQVLTEYYTDKIQQYLVAVQPSAGQLELASRPGLRVEAFTPLQLEQGLISYVHDGTERLTDAFSLVAVSGVRQSAPAQLNVTVRGVNDEAPFVMNNTGINIWEGDKVVLSSDNLAAMDLDTNPENLTISVGTPDSGFLSWTSNMTQQITRFTQADLNAGRVTFIHTGGLSGMFRWEASDQVHSTGSSVFTVTARALRITLVRNEQLHVFPMMQQPLSSASLLAVTNDYNVQRSLVFVIKQAPALGQLLLEEAGGVPVPVDNFTQRHLNESRIIFEHTVPFSDLSASDMFIFDVETPFADPLKNQEFHIEISVASHRGGGLERFLGLAPLVVAEGGQATVRQDNLNLSAVLEFIETYPGAGMGVRFPPQLIATVTSTPVNGIFTLKERNMTEGYTFTVRDIDRGRVRYEHDHSDTLTDSLGFTVHLAGNGSSPDVLLFNGSLNVSVTPVNDQPFTLITDSPVLHVVHRQSAIITNQSLLTIDPDNVPKDIVYELMKAPDHGRLILVDNFSIAVHSFSQEDVDSGRILYAHDGSNGSARFYFKVSDGKHDAKYSVFTIEVEPLSLELVNHTVIPLQQTQAVTYVMSRHLAARTNGNQNHIFYNVTRPPRFGRLYMDHQVIHTFGQTNIDKTEVMYEQRDLTESSDSFRIDIWTWEASIHDVEVRIVVTPLVETKPLIATVGGRTRLTLEHLDASQLAAKTGSTPVYKVKKRPRFGKLKKISRRARRSGRSYEVQEFTHEDIKAGLIFYIARNINLRADEPLHDHVHYILKVPAPDFQPAEGTLRLTLVEKMEEGRALEEDTIPPRHLRPEIYSPSDSGESSSPNSKTSSLFPGIPMDYMIVIVASVAGVLAIIALVVLVRCATRRRRSDKRSDVGMDGDVASLPPPLPSDSRPNSFMTDDMSELECRPPELPSSPRPGRHHHLHNGGSGGMGLAAHLTDSDASWPRDPSREVSPAVPQCKVTPLCADTSPRESPYDPHLAGYPYGVNTEQAEEWGLYEKHQPRTTNPMLRKNQYWV